MTLRDEQDDSLEVAVAAGSHGVRGGDEGRKRYPRSSKRDARRWACHRNMLDPGASWGEGVGDEEFRIHERGIHEGGRPRARRDEHVRAGER